jgi:hypothetical protein
VTVPSKISPHLFLNETLTEADLAKSRLCIAAMTTLQHLAGNGGIGLTKSGAFNRNFVVWAVDQFEWPGYTAKELSVANKVLNEDDVLPLSCLHELLRLAKLILHANGRALLARAGTTHLGDHGRLQATLFETFFTKFDFAAYERWPIEMPDADTFHFLGVIRNRLADWVPYSEFAGWCLPISALPVQRGTPEEDAIFYLATRLVGPLTWLGLLEQKEMPRMAPLRTLQLRKTPLFDTFLRCEIRRDGPGTMQ